MSVNNIKDVKNVDSENFDYLLAESNFRIESVFRQRNKRVIEPNVPMICDLVSDTISSKNDYDTKYQPDNAKTKTGGTFDFLMPANEYGLMDLRDGEFVVQAQFAYMDNSGTNGKEGIVNAPRFGNQCLMSLFQQIQLFIDDQEVQCNKWPGFSSNAEFALRYPHCKTLEEDYEIHGYNRTDESCYKLTEGISSVNPEFTISEVEQSFKNQGITLKIKRIAPVAATSPAYYIYTGFITQRIKISDIFSVVDTLPPLYNHSVLIRFNRTPNNDIICNTCTMTGVKCNFLGFQKFKLYQDVFVTTDQFIQTAKKYYSKPIETLITQDKQYFQPIISEPGGNNTQEFNINIDAAYKNKLITLAIPRTTNFAYQANKGSMYYMAPTYSTDLSNLKNKPDLTLEFDDDNLTGITAAGVSSLEELNLKQFDNTVAEKHYDTLKAPANSYTYGGLRALEVVNASAGTKLYNFEMENDGVIKGNSSILATDSVKTQYNYRTGTADIRLANYEDVYRQYVKARLHFQQSEDEALDFNTFMKEYCIFCVDLSPFDISPGDQIKITMTFSDWSATYNPFYSYNCKKFEDNTDGRYTSSNIICNLFCDKVLRLLPGRQIQLADMISTSSVEVENATMA